MKAKPTKRKRAGKRYDFNLRGSFLLQFGFTDSQVEQDPEGSKGDVRPTDKALRSLVKELTDVLGDYGIGDLELFADSDDLLGVVDE